MIGKSLFRGCIAGLGVMIAVIIWLVPASADTPADRQVDGRIPPLATVEPAGPIVPIPTPEQAFSPVFLEHDPPSILSLTEEGCCAGSAWSIDSEWILYFDKPSSDDPVGLYETMRKAKRSDNTPVFTTATSMSLLVFYVLAMQCLPTQVVTKRETGSLKWAVFQFAYMTVLAYVAAFITFNLVSMISA